METEKDREGGRWREGMTESEKETDGEGSRKERETERSNISCCC